MSIDISTILGADGFEWTWQTQYQPREQKDDPTSFQQSTFYNPKDSTSDLYRRKSSNSRPSLTLSGRLAHHALGLMQTDLTIGEIAAVLAEENPQLSWPSEDWLKFVIKLSTKYSD